MIQDRRSTVWFAETLILMLKFNVHINFNIKTNKIYQLKYSLTQTHYHPSLPLNRWRGFLLAPEKLHPPNCTVWSTVSMDKLSCFLGVYDWRLKKTTLIAPLTTNIKQIQGDRPLICKDSDVISGLLEQLPLILTMPKSRTILYFSMIMLAFIHNYWLNCSLWLLFWENKSEIVWFEVGTQAVK